MSISLHARNLVVKAGPRTLIRDLELELGAGEAIVILGVNGAGKTSLLETLCRLRPPHSGTIRIGDDAIGELAPRLLARHIALMPQGIEDGFDHSVQRLVALGRYARGGLWQWRDEEDLVASNRALTRVGLADQALRSSATLSGGERQRVALAMLLAQAPRLMLLDEPFSQLDPAHRRQALGLMRELRDQGHGLMLSVHDVNIAAHVADRVLMLHGDGRWELGSRTEMLTQTRLTELYATPVCRIAGDADYFVFGD